MLELVADTGRPASLVGWSLGGVIAREVARRHPDAVRRVITYGTPVTGGPRHTTVARALTRGARPAARTVAERCLSLPVHPALSEDDLDLVANALRKALG